MVSSKRISKAKRQAKHAFLATHGNPNLTENPYQKYSAQGKVFSKEYSRLRNKFKFLMRIK